MLIVIVLETNNKEGSDYLYFKSIMYRFYKERGSGISIKPVFMKGKGNYDKVERQIKNLTKQYTGVSKVIYFFDIDSPQLKYDQKQLNEKIKNYCKAKNYEAVWFNKTIEEVLIGNVITKNKTEIAKDFFIKNKIMDVNKENLNIDRFGSITSKKSNVLYILDKYLEKKE